MYFCNLDISPIFTLTYTGCCIDTIGSADDEHEVARKMQGIEINTQKRIVRRVGHLPRIITRCMVKKYNILQQISIFRISIFRD